MNITNIKHHFTAALTAAALVVALLTVSFFILEPAVGRAVDSDDFRVRQQITDEISFLVQPATTVTMNGTIQGLTGGQATGTVYAVVRTNNTNGYTMTINWFDNGSNHAMQGETNNSDAIRNYATTSILASETPTFDFDYSSSSAVFAYTVNASGTPSAVLADAFLDNGSACGQAAGSYTANRCWMGAGSTTYPLVNTSAAAADGSTTTIQFRVFVPSSPNPVLEPDWYTATATLTATNN